VHVITKKRIHEAVKRFPEAESALYGWYRLISKNSFQGFASLKAFFGSVDKVGSLYVFDVAGNKLRIIASIHFNRQRVYIRHILNHNDYDKQKWKKSEKLT
jgi:mRNA interferase HigB